MGAAAAIIIAKETHIVREFQRRGVTSPDRAQSLDMMLVDPDGIGARRLIERAVLRQEAPGQYYVDVEVWEAVRRMRRRVMFVLIFLALAAAAVVATQANMAR